MKRVIKSSNEDFIVDYKIPDEDPKEFLRRSAQRELADEADYYDRSHLEGRYQLKDIHNASRRGLWSGSIDELFTNLDNLYPGAQLFEGEQYIYTFAVSDIYKTRFIEANSAHSFAVAQEAVEDWLNPASHTPADDRQGQKTYSASIIDLDFGKEVYYESVPGYYIDGNDVIQ